jgi:tetratricopeptide (TPR) repeat protein
MNKQQFLDKFKELKSPANAELREVLKLWLIEGKSDGEIAKTLNKDRSTATRKIGDICKYFGTGAKGRKEQRQYLVLLFRKYCLDFEVHPSIYSEWGDGDLSDRSYTKTNQPNITTEIVISPKNFQKLTTSQFIGRDRDLTTLVNLSNQSKILLIKAGSGVGKSTLAREFLRSRFKQVIRLEMGMEFKDITPANEKIAQILRKDFDEPPSQDFGINLDTLRDKLSDRVNPIAVLIDNLESALDENYRFREKLRGYDALLAVLGDLDVCSFTLITSRRSLITPRAKVHEYVLDGLDITAWQQYFHDCENGTDPNVLIQMREAYNGNAKVMDILHGAIKNRFDGNIGAYWSRYKDALLADPELETLISVEMDWLLNNQPDAYKLLCRMGCYRYQDIKTFPFEGLISLLWDIPKSQRFGIIDYLSRTSLIEVKDGYYLHPAVRESALSRLKLDVLDWELTNINAAEFWTQSITSIATIEDALRAFKAYYHYLNINKYELACDVIVKERNNNWEDKESLGKSFYRLGLLETIKLAINKIIIHLSNSYNLSRLYNILGDVHWLMGEISESIYSHEKSKKTAIEVSAQDIEVVALFSIGLCQIDIWEIHLAIENFEKCIQLAINKNQVDYIVQSYYCLGFLNSLLGFKERANDFINKTFEDFNLTNCSAWSTGYRWLFLGGAYMNLLDIKKSSDMFTIARTYAEERYYPQVKANALTGLAAISRIQNDWNRAISYLHESIGISRTIGARCDLAKAYFQMGLTYQAMGEHDQAEEYRLKSLTLFAQMEAPKQIERVNKAFEKEVEK